MDKYDVVVLGSGPAGYTAAIYLARGGFKPLVLTGNQLGGQLILTTHIENYPGFPDGVTGMELMSLMKQQAEKFGSQVAVDSVTKIEKQDSLFKVSGGKGDYFGKAILVATGASAVWLSVPGVGEFRGKGISACATCDGPFFKDKTVAVIGGGDTAFTEVEFLSRFVKKIYLIHRREEYRAEKILQERVLKNEKVIPLYNSQVVSFLGKEKLEGAEIESHFKVESEKYINEISSYPDKYGIRLISKDREKIIWRVNLEGVFMAIGHKPNTGFLNGFLEIDKEGYIVTRDEVITSVDGVFAAGDVICNVYKQATIAVGSGCKAAIEIQNYLRKVL